jgi:hypothetical protein
MAHYCEIRCKAVCHHLQAYICVVLPYIAQKSQELIILCTNLTVKLNQLVHYKSPSYQCLGLTNQLPPSLLLNNLLQSTG